MYFALGSQLQLPWWDTFKKNHLVEACYCFITSTFEVVLSFFCFCLFFSDKPWEGDKQTVASSKDVLPCKQLPLQDKLLLFSLRGALIPVHPNHQGKCTLETSVDILMEVFLRRENWPFKERFCPSDGIIVDSEQCLENWSRFSRVFVPENNKIPCWQCLFFFYFPSSWNSALVTPVLNQVKSKLGAITVLPKSWWNVRRKQICYPLVSIIWRWFGSMQFGFQKHASKETANCFLVGQNNYSDNRLCFLSHVFRIKKGFQEGIWNMLRNFIYFCILLFHTLYVSAL